MTEGLPAIERPYSPATLAKRWGCSTTLIYDLLNAGALPGFRAGKLWRIPAASVAEYEARPQPAPDPVVAAEIAAASAAAPTYFAEVRKAAATATRLARLTA